MRLKILKNLFFVGIILTLNSCAQMGWSGYYESYPEDAPNKYIAESAINSTPIIFKNENNVQLELPRDCSTFRIAGFITPITPPIPLFYFRSWSSAGKNGDGLCHNFLIETKPKTKAILKVGDKIFEPEIREGRWGYTKYIFPVRAKDIDSGIIILEKDGQKVEVPFEYKYFRFISGFV